MNTQTTVSEAENAFHRNNAANAQVIFSLRQVIEDLARESQALKEALETREKEYKALLDSVAKDLKGS